MIEARTFAVHPMWYYVDVDAAKDSALDIEGLIRRLYLCSFPGPIRGAVELRGVDVTWAIDAGPLASVRHTWTPGRPIPTGAQRFIVRARPRPPFPSAVEYVRDSDVSIPAATMSKPVDIHGSTD